MSEYHRAYSRGYNAGVRNRWPGHRPPQPPNTLIAELMSACQALRDAVDGELGMLGEDDPWQESLGNPLDDVDEVMEKVSAWLRKGGAE